MRGMAVGAYRRALIAFGQQLPVNALVVGLFDAQMAFAAGLGDVGVVDGGIAVHGAFDVMHAMAIVAGGRHDQTHFDQRLAVDAVQYSVAALGCLISYSLVRPGLLWHLPHVRGRFILKTGDAGLLTGRMSCEPWQSQQFAAPDEPSRWLTP